MTDGSFANIVVQGSLSFDICEIISIESGAFRNVSVGYLDLSKIDIENIDKDAFANSTINYLYLSSNELTAIPYDASKTFFQQN